MLLRHPCAVQVGPVQLASSEHTHDLISELRAARPVAILVDGLEKAAPATAQAVARELVRTARDISLVLVLSPALLMGPDAYEVIEDLGLRPLALRPVLVRPPHGEHTEAGLAFLREIAARRLGSDAVAASVVDDAARLSGGIPRTFLQLLRDAYTSAAFAGRETPTGGDLVQAQHEHRASLRRLLAAGDLELLQNATETSGVEIPVAARVRMLALVAVPMADRDAFWCRYLHNAFERRRPPPPSSA